MLEKGELYTKAWKDKIKKKLDEDQIGKAKTNLDLSAEIKKARKNEEIEEAKRGGSSFD